MEHPTGVARRTRAGSHTTASSSASTRLRSSGSYTRVKGGQGLVKAALERRSKFKVEEPEVIKSGELIEKIIVE